MPTRTVGTCCCGIPNFSVNFHVWIALNLGFAYEMYQGERRLQCNSFTSTFLSDVPAKWKIEIYYPETGRTWTGGYPTGSGWTDYNSGMTDFDRTSLVAIGGGSKWGGIDHDSTDPNDWVALSNVSSFGFSISPSPIGMPAYDDNIENYCKFLLPSSDWTYDFTFNGATYRLTIPQDWQCTRDRLYQKHITEVDDEMTSGIWYARYKFDWFGHITRVSVQNNS